MDRETAIKLLKELQPTVIGDEEDVHIKADRILCELLESIGYADVITEYKKLDEHFWYA